MCRFEQMEPRQLLSADFATIQIGAVYFEDSIGIDAGGDLFEITFSGGAPGTQLTELIIDTDKRADGGLTDGDPFFDVDANPPGVSGADPLIIDTLRTTGIDHIDTPTISADNTKLVMHFTGFDPGDRLVFSVDVDEEGYPVTPVVEGREFQYSRLEATFVADNYFDASGVDDFLDEYNDKLEASKLVLPADRYTPPTDEASLADQTAGAFFPVEQTPLPTISGTVFEDMNLDNDQDPGDPGIAGVDLVLEKWDGSSYIATTHAATTDGDGDYKFIGVQPGTYRIAEEPLTEYFDVGATAGTVGGLTRGVVTGVNEISDITLVRGDDSIDNDFAEAKPASLSGNVYHDRNDDGVMDPGEEGIANVTIEVRRVSGPGGPMLPRQTTTDQFGAWSVENLMPGEYLVTEIQPDPQVYIDGLDTPGDAGGEAHNPGDLIDGIHLGSGQAGEEYNFGEIMFAGIAGRVIADMNGNCVYDKGDVLLKDVTIELLDADGQVLRTTTTDEKGEYSFAGLVPGVYGVRETTPQDYFDGGDHVGSESGTLLDPDSIIDITLGSGVVGVGYDFCELLPSSISGHVYVDDNGNGQHDPTELLLEDVVVHLLDAQGKKIATTETNALGEYSFDTLAPGIYGVEEEQPEEYFDGPDHQGSVGGSLLPPDSIIDIELISATHAVNYDFRETPPATISGYVYADDDDNGLFDKKSESPIAGVTLSLLDATGTATGETTETDANGFYRFDGLAPGTYGVAEEQPGDFYDGRDTAGTSGGTAEDSPGDRITGARLKAGVDALNYNFGELRPASIGGRVHADLIVNCQVDEDEPLLSGVTIYLLDASGNRIDKTETNDQGIYLFENLRPGVYGVEEIQPEGYLDGRDHAGDAGGHAAQDDRITGAQLGPGVDGRDYNFCEIVPARISGYVFRDGPVIRILPGDETPDPADVSDGKLTSDDKRIAGVVMTLADASGVALLDENGQPITTTTDAEGYYEFTNLAPGLYSIIESHPDRFIDGIDSPGLILDVNGNVVSSPDDPVPPSTGLSQFGGPNITGGSRNGTAINAHEPDSQQVLQTLAIDPKNDAIVKIYLNPGEQGTSYNFSEVQMTRMPIPIPDPEPDPRPDPKPITPFDPPEMPYIPPPPVYVAPRGFDLFGHTGGYTWHLSVLNAGRPRRDGHGNYPETAYADDPRFGALGWSTVNLDQSQWILADDQGIPVNRVIFGTPGGIPVVGDFNGDGIDDVGVFVDGYWMLDLNGNGIWDDGDLLAHLGARGDQPVVGDWDADGKDDIGIFGPAWVGDINAVEHDPGMPDVSNEPTPSGARKNVPPKPEFAAILPRTLKRTMEGETRRDVVDHTFLYGIGSDRAIVGDFNGDGVTTIGVFREGVWILDSDANGRLTKVDKHVEFGQAGDLPVVGDFNGDGIDELGVYRTGMWYLDTDGNQRLDAHDKVFEMGGPGDQPVVGDFNGDGVDEIAVYQENVTAPPTQTAE